MSGPVKSVFKGVGSAVKKLAPVALPVAAMAIGAGAFAPAVAAGGATAGTVAGTVGPAAGFAVPGATSLAGGAASSLGTGLAAGSSLLPTDSGGFGDILKSLDISGGDILSGVGKGVGNYLDRQAEEDLLEKKMAFTREMKMAEPGGPYEPYSPTFTETIRNQQKRSGTLPLVSNFKRV